MKQPLDYGVEPRGRSHADFLFALLGIVLLVLWLGADSVTVVPGSPAVLGRWIFENASLFCSGISFGVAVCLQFTRRMQTAA